MALPRISIPDLINSRQNWPFSLHTPDTGDALRMQETTSFGQNPGALRLFSYVPENLPRSAPLVVVLHGCGQTAAGYDRGAGWSELADQHGFAVLAPEQASGNNANTCFNWFQDSDIVRGQGEAASIRSMIEHMAVTHALDRNRVFVTGLSAGAAMAAVMLATYPEVFAGGAIIAGLPYGTARGLQEALPAMFHPQPRAAKALGDLVRAGSPHPGPWPAVAIWHGDADRTVVAQNADESVKQWLDVHGLTGEPQCDIVDGVPHRVWRDRDGRAAVESYIVPGLAHGTPVNPAASEGGVGAPAPFILASPISSSWRIAQSWGLTSRTVVRPAQAPKPAQAAAPVAHAAGKLGVTGVIEQALRAAGLMGRN